MRHDYMRRVKANTIASSFDVIPVDKRRLSLTTTPNAKKEKKRKPRVPNIARVDDAVPGTYLPHRQKAFGY